MAIYRIVLCAGLAALTLAPANLTSASAPATLSPVALAAACPEVAAGEPVTSAMLLGGACILMIAGRRRRY